MSTGQRLRVTVARSLSTRPHLILADEPTAALDPYARDGVMEMLQEICREEKAILIVASHDPVLNRRFDRIVDLDAGTLRESGSARFAVSNLRPLDMAA